MAYVQANILLTAPYTTPIGRAVQASLQFPGVPLSQAQDLLQDGGRLDILNISRSPGVRLMSLYIELSLI